MRVSVIIYLLLAVILLAAFNQTRHITDKSEFATVRIGDHEWMAENLNVSHFRNGDPIAHAETVQEWLLYSQQGRPAWCYYENDPVNGKSYGKLYNWFAVNDPRGLAPEGWRIPIDIEWEELGRALGGEETAGHKMKSVSGWKDDGNGSNESGFNALAGGYRHYSGGFFSVGDNAFWWSADVYDAENAFGSYVSKSLDNLYRNYFSKRYGFSLRCVRE